MSFPSFYWTVKVLVQFALFFSSTPSDMLKYGSARTVVGTAQKPKRDARNFNDKTVLQAAINQVSVFKQPRFRLDRVAKVNPELLKPLKKH